jgi:hypothetical protein
VRYFNYISVLLGKIFITFIVGVINNIIKWEIGTIELMSFELLVCFYLYLIILYIYFYIFYDD